MLSFLSPDPSILQLNAVHSDDQQVVLTLEVIQPWAECPACHCPSIRVHSGYVRTVADLPAGGCQVRLLLSVRRFFCDQPDCPKRTFTERIPTVVAHYARKTVRLVQAQSRIGFVIGGEAGARISTDLSLPTSPDTLLRMVRDHPESTVPSVRYLGVDDWAFRKSSSYGTILVNLETHRPIDLLPDRTAQSLMAWLKDHPEVKLVTRDRFPAYKEAIQQAAPDAIQVVDRFHLFHNLTEAVERILSKEYKLLQETFREPDPPDPLPSGAVQDAIEAEPTHEPTARSPGMVERNRQIHREQKQAQFQEVKRLAAEGMGIREIQRKLHLSRERIRNYLHTEDLPEYQRRRRSTSLAPYWEEVKQRWQDGCRKGMDLWRAIQAKGYPGTYASFARQIRPLRQKMPPIRKRPTVRKRMVPSPTPSMHPPTPRQVTWWFARDPEKLEEDQMNSLKKLLENSSDLQQVYSLVQEFREMIHAKKVNELSSWLERAKQAQSSELTYFAIGLEKDLPAVEAALTYAWSNGPVEGHNNRLKMLKRQMYGRAGFDLLRLRVLYA